MTEIWRLREISFRMAGGGTGKEVDIDAYDTMPNPYKQLIVWDPAEKEISWRLPLFCLLRQSTVMRMETAIWLLQGFLDFQRNSGKNTSPI